MGFANILVITKTHKSLVRPLPEFTSYQWLFVCREEVRASSGVCGSSGIACLIRDSICSCTSIVHSNMFARFMWVHIDRKSHRQRDFFIVVCYFPPVSFHYAIHGTKDGDPFVDLSECLSIRYIGRHHHSR